MSEREKIILSTVGGIVTLVLGYLIWRHEQTIVAQDNANTVAANEQIAQQQQQQLADALAALPAGGSFSSASASDYSNENFGSTSTAASPVDNNIAAILAAFFPQPTAPTTPATSQLSNVDPTPFNGGPVAGVKGLPASGRINIPPSIVPTSDDPTLNMSGPSLGPIATPIFGGGGRLRIFQPFSNTVQ